jgi:hypothetical protein
MADKGVGRGGRAQRSLGTLIVPEALATIGAFAGAFRRNQS